MTADEKSIDALLATLTPREAKMMRYKFGIGVRYKSDAEIAEHFQLHPDRVEQIFERVRNKLAHPIRSRYKPHHHFDW